MEPQDIMDDAHHHSGTALMTWCSATAEHFDAEAQRARQGQPVTLQQQAETFARLAEFCRRLEGHTHMGLGRTPRVPWIVRVWRAILSA